MLGVTLGSELFWNRRDRTVKEKKWCVNLESIPFNENRMKISIKNSTVDLN